ncbi:MAG: hypothetical protein R3D26_02150 [Cyanobacteriota/Melainabacteria group bacterium]
MLEEGIRYSHSSGPGKRPADKENKLAELAGVYLVAGRKARTNLAYHSAIQFLTYGKELLGDTGWQEAPELAYDLHYERALCEWMCGNFDRSMNQFDELLTHCDNVLQKTSIYQMMVELYAGKTELALARGKRAQRVWLF